MGCTCTRSHSSEEIDQEIARDQIHQNQTAKLLLLGNSDSGKSTLVKQMRIVHCGGFDNLEMKNYRHLIFGNIIEAIENLVEGAGRLDIAFDQQTQMNISSFFELVARCKIDDVGISTLASKIWQSPQIQETFAQKPRLSFVENVEHFLSNLERIASDAYVPTNMDILYCRSHTSGVYTTEFSQADKRIKLIDVGGQRSERRKWIHCFDDVTAILFVAALSAYDQKLEEKSTDNRMFDALALFDEICTSKYFQKASVVLFLNKKDIFEEKIKIIPLTVCFSDYAGENNYESASAYIATQFVVQHVNEQMQIFTHFTNATDTENIEIVFQDVIDTLIRRHIETTAFE